MSLSSQKGDATISLSLHPAANAASADILVATTTAAASCLNSVNTSSSDVLFSAVGLFPRRQTGLLTIQLSWSVSRVQNQAPSLYQLLLPPHKVSPIRVDRLRKEPSAHPDRQFVEYVLTGIQEGFHVGFNPASVCLAEWIHMMTFILWVRQNSQKCKRNLEICVQRFSEWGIPLHPAKLEGPSTRLTVLGIELDSLQLQARLPQDKFDCILALLNSWSHKWHCTRKELESLIGNLQHACKVVPAGRTFLRRMINLLYAFCQEDHPIRLKREFHLDLTWWREFSPHGMAIVFFCTLNGLQCLISKLPQMLLVLLDMGLF